MSYLIHFWLWAGQIWPLLCSTHRFVVIIWFFRFWNRENISVKSTNSAWYSFYPFAKNILISLVHLSFIFHLYFVYSSIIKYVEHNLYYFLIYPFRPLVDWKQNYTNGTDKKLIIYKEAFPISIFRDFTRMQIQSLRPGSRKLI